MLRGVLEAQAPPKQNATDTINVLSSRLASATLVEDRRGAILGLRSFAKTYPASVASGSLRGLIAVLANDVEDIDTAKVVLETLLMLFNPSEDSPEASDDIKLWLADEFSVRQDNITILLSLLGTTDFYSRLYALQLLSAVALARPERTQECILSAPLGTTRLVSTLDDSRDAIKSAGLLLLTDITQSSPELQKLVAFENAFERIFRMIQAEGSFATGGIVVQDCLALLLNLLDLNPSNQSLFRESGFFGKVAKLLADDAQEALRQLNGNMAMDGTRDKNLWGLLIILKKFLIQGNTGTQANQNAFEKQGLLQVSLNMGFDQTLGPSVRAEALSTCAEVIKGNGKLQERFAHNKVLSPIASAAESGSRKSQEKVYIMDALLNMSLSVPTLSLFDVRFAASDCILAYFYNHQTIRHHFLRRAIEGHTSGEDETGNVLTILIEGPHCFTSSDPYRLWFAARIVFALLGEDSEAKQLAMSIKEGDAESGEEVVTSLQALTGNLLSSIQSGDDDRICTGYLMLLCGWLFDEPDAVNDVLQEGSSVQSLVQAASRTGKGTEMVSGLCAVFLGILYEFSTKDSPISRRQLQPLLTSGLGRETYVSRIQRLRQLPMVRDFEVSPKDLSSAQPGDLPGVYFDEGFVNLLKDNFNRLIRAIDRNPALEVARTSEGIDRDVVDSLRAQIADKSQAVQKAQSDVVAMERILGQEQADHRRTQDIGKAEVARIKNINEALQQGHEAEVRKADAEHRSVLSKLEQQHKKHMDDLERIRKVEVAHTDRRAETATRQLNHENAGLQQRVKSLEIQIEERQQAIEKLQRGQRDAAETLRQRDEQLTTSKKDIQQREALSKDLRTTVQQRDAQLSEARGTVLDREAEIHDLRDTLEKRDADLQQATQSVRQKEDQITGLRQKQRQLEDQMASLETDNTRLTSSAGAQENRVNELAKRLEQSNTDDKQTKSNQEELQKVQEALKAKEDARHAAQTELDDLLIVLSDLEEKRTRDKRKLREVGAEVSDLEDEDDANGDEADQDDDDNNEEEYEEEEEALEKVAA